jgi:hypothetical protein
VHDQVWRARVLKRGWPAAERGCSATCMRTAGLIGTLVLCVSAVAATPGSKVTGTYSSLTYNNESGDLGGTEISIVPGAGGYFAIAQCAEGQPGIPVVVRAQVVGMKVSFELQKGTSSGCPEAPYTGTVSAAGLKGQFSGFGEPELLKRKVSYWN